jgi:hypothetical protein
VPILCLQVILLPLNLYRLRELNEPARAPALRVVEGARR